MANPQSAIRLMARDKFRIRFKKVGDLRMVSHHDLMRCFERMLRRAALPFRSTEGFNPKPKMAFALSLALGIEGLDEVVELELETNPPSRSEATLPSPTASGGAGPGVRGEDVAHADDVPSPPTPLPRIEGEGSMNPLPGSAGEGTVDSTAGTISEKEVQARLEAQAPAGLVILSVRRIEPRVKAQPRRVCYRLDLPPERCAGVPELIEAVLAAPEAWVERSRPEVRRVDVRPYLRHLHLDSNILEMDLWVTPTGTARPDDVLGLLGLGDLPNSGAVIRRTLLELHDESVESGAPSHEPGMEAPVPAGVAPHAAE